MWITVMTGWSWMMMIKVIASLCASIYVFLQVQLLTTINIYFLFLFQFQLMVSSHSPRQKLSLGLQDQYQTWLMACGMHEYLLFIWRCAHTRVLKFIASGPPIYIIVSMNFARVSCDRALMRRPALRLGIIIYWAVLHALLANFVVWENRTIG